MPHSSFIAAAVVRRGDLTVAISTGGKAPALAVRLRERLERELGAEHARFLELAGAVRAPLAARHPDFARRRELWYQLVDSDVLDLLRRGDEPAARRRFAEILGVEVPVPAPAATGRRRAGFRTRGRAALRTGDRGHRAVSGAVYLVGAGPGDPDLLTVRGLRCLQRADVVVYDRLLDPRLLEEAPRRARRIYAGKSPGRHALRQEEINALLVRHARAGRTVVRLKGGDPFVFGRGGEEALACIAAGIPWEVVPGVTSAVAVPARAGIPLTHRGVAASFAVATGHAAGDDEDGHDWAALARVDTLVFLMGAGHLAEIAALLVAHGRPPHTPAAAIERGTLPGERVLEGTLATLPELAAREGLASPATLVVGEVVRLRQSLAESPALTGVRSRFSATGS